MLTIIRLFRTYRPMGYFGFISAVLAVLSIAFVIPVLLAFLQTGKVEKFPTLIVCGFVAITSIQSFFAGLTLKTIYQKNRQDFEMALYRVTADEIAKRNNTA